MTERADTLQELVVTRRLVERQGLTDSFMVDKGLRANTHEAADILGKLPGFHYNPLDRVVTYLGSENVIILVDSLEKDEAYIKRLNPGRIARVSVTNSPGGMYTGYDAVVNLVTVKDYDGIDLVALSEAGVRTGGRNGRGKPLSDLREVLEYTHTHNSWNIAFSGSYNWLRNGQGAGSEHIYLDNNYTQKIPLPSLSRPNRTVRQSKGTIDLWVDRILAPGHTLSLGVGFNPSSGEVREQGRIISGSLANPVDTAMQHVNDRQTGLREYRAMAQYTGNAGGWSLDARVAYTHNAFDRRYSLRRNGFGITDNRHVATQYVWGGAGGSKSVLDSKLMFSLSDYVTWIDYHERSLDTHRLLSTTVELRNRISATIQYSPSWRWSVGASAGANMTRTSVSGVSHTRVTPRLSVNAMWNSSRIMWRLSYVTGTLYPSLSMQQDFGTFYDSLVYKAGNPLLSPSVYHQGRLMTNIMRHLTVSGDYTYTHNSVFNIAGMEFGMRPDGDEGSYLGYIYRNGESWEWNANVNYSNTFKNRLSVSATVSLQGRKARYSGTELSKTLPRYDWYVAYMDNRLGLQAYLSSSLHSALSVTPQEVGWELYDGYALSAVKFLFRGRLQMMVMWTLPVHLIRKPYRSRLDIPGYVATTVTDNYRRNDNKLTLTAVWRFSTGDRTRKINRQTESVDIL